MGAVVTMMWSLCMLIFTIIPMMYITSVLISDPWISTVLSFSMSWLLITIGYIADRVSTTHD